MDDCLFLTGTYLPNILRFISNRLKCFFLHLQPLDNELKHGQKKLYKTPKITPANEQVIRGQMEKLKIEQDEILRELLEKLTPFHKWLFLWYLRWLYYGKNLMTRLAQAWFDLTVR